MTPLPSTLHLPTTLSPEHLEVFAAGLSHPEGVVWCAERKVLYAGGERGELYRVSMSGEVAQFAETGSGGCVLGLALDGEGRLYVCDEGGHRVVRIDPDRGGQQVLSEGTADRPMMTPNYPVFDAAGRLFVSDSGEWGKADGVVYVIEPDGLTTVWTDALPHFTNGMALSPDARHLYVVESSSSTVSRVMFGPDGSPGSPVPVFSLPGSVPDGLALDVAGNLYIGCYQPDAIFHVSPGSEVTGLVHDWTGQVLSRPTNLAFAGAAHDVLITANLGGAHLTRVRHAAVGLPPLRPLLGGR